ncbi:MAG TPA: FHA domain-containing protein [Acidimicrobiales bacterium]|jgi:pSer/pThr/pTyr-binding forkhead associated (FHA) protein|nr:FHA domain-containing protein [Acidimicrobiales bacterium]
MPEPLLAVLKLLCLALLYLFFLRVLRAVWAELRPPPPAPPSAPPTPARRRDPAPQGRRRKGAGHLVIVAPADQKGRSFDLNGELTVGRAAGCQVALEDNYVSQLHARVFTRDGGVWVEDLGSTNGTYLNDQRVSAPLALRRGDQLKVGSTVMELKR